jgi:BASS family bile acid:Na+ symporter
MAQVLQAVLDIAVVVFPVTSLFAVGLAHDAAELVAPLRHPHRLVRALIANFVLVPLLTFALCRLLSLERPLEIGLLLVSTAAGAPFLIKLTQMAGGDVGLSASLLLVLVPATVVYMPLVVPVIEPQARVGAAAIALPLGLTLILPLCVGLGVRRLRARWAAAWIRPLGHASTGALGAVIGATLLLSAGRIARLAGSGAILAALLMILGAFAIGYLMAVPNPGARTSLGLGTAQRNIAAALVVASESFHHPDTLLVGVIASLLDLLVLFPIAWGLRRRSARRLRSDAVA